MSKHRYDVLGIGNAIVDIIAHTDEAFLISQNVQKGAMILVDEPRAEALYQAMGPAVIVSGGCAANTVAGLASFGGRGAFIGKVRTDELGGRFTHDIRALGIHFPTAPAVDGPATARSMILVTPDGERTMNTYLGACQNLTPADIERETVEASGIVYLEGYLWDPPAAKEAFVKAADIAHAAEGRVAITLSDSFCVDRYRDEFLGLIRNGKVDIVFANEHELKSLYQTASFDAAVAAFREDCKLGIMTRGANGSIVVQGHTTVIVDPLKVDEVVDTTGAGDLFAAGFLFGYTRGFDFGHCGKLGSLAAGLVIQQVGPRLQISLKDEATQAGLL